MTTGDRKYTVGFIGSGQRGFPKSGLGEEGDVIGDQQLDSAIAPVRKCRRRKYR